MSSRSDHLAREVRLSRQTLFKGRVLDLFVDQIRTPDGQQHVREVVGHKAAVAVVPVLPDGRIILVRQFRYAVGKSLWELPAGLMDADETPRQAAARELREETGYQSRQWQALGAVYSSPGFCREKIHLFFAKQVELVGQQHLDADEFVTFAIFSQKKIQAMLQKAEIQDAKTALGLRWAFPTLR